MDQIKPTFLLRDRNFVSKIDTIIKGQSFDWDVDYNCCRSGDVTVFTDLCLGTVDNCNSRYKVAWIMESPEINWEIYLFIQQHYNKFDAVLTYWTHLLSLSNKFVYYPNGNAWINGDDQQIYKKDKMLSIIASKKYSTSGHRLRHDIVSSFHNYPGFDLYGYAYTPLDNKLDGLRNYRYSFAIENCRYNTYFTEKLLDCFLTGTIPIFWGAPEITKFFNPAGIISFSSIEEVPSILNSLSNDDYTRRLPAIVDNFHTAKKYVSSNTNTWNVYFKKLSEELYGPLYLH